jgi:hypothetical protein
MKNLLTFLFVSIIGLSNLIAQRKHTDVTINGNVKTITTYDRQNRKIHVVGQSWTESERAPFPYWKTNMEEFFYYDAHNNMYSHLSKIWDGNNAYQAYLATYTFNKQNAMTSDLYQTWNCNSHAWDNNNRHIYGFDSTNINQDTDTYQQWDCNKHAWANQSRTSSTRNANNAVTVNLIQSWNYNSNSWVNSTRTVFTYNENNTLASQQQQYWNGTAWANKIIRRRPPRPRWKSSAPQPLTQES